MGTSTSGRELVGKVANYRARFDDMRPALVPAAEIGKQIFRAAAASAGVLGTTLEGKRKPIGVKDDFLDKKTVFITYTGPAHLVNNPTAPHAILPKGLGGKTRRARVRRGQAAAVASVFGGSSSLGSFTGKGARALTIEGDVRARAFHPGTKGKRFFQGAKPIVQNRVPPIVAKRVHTEWLRKSFGL